MITVDVTDGLALALAEGRNRIFAAVERGAKNKAGFSDRNPVSEQKSILTEMAVFKAAGKEIFDQQYFFPNVWNGERWVMDPRCSGTDVGRIEVRCGSLRGGLRTYGKDYMNKAWLLQANPVVNPDGTPTGIVHLIGWQDAYADWRGTPSDQPPVRKIPCYREKKYTDFPIDVRRDLDTLDWNGVWS